MAASLTRAQVDAIVHALALVLPARSPADVVLKHYFREHRSLGSRDRALVADTVYSVLRRRRLLEALTPSSSPREMALASLVKLQGVGIGQIESLIKSSERNWLAQLKAVETDALPFEVRADLPDWVLERLRRRYADAEILALARSLQHPAPLDLRVNTRCVHAGHVAGRVVR